MKTIQALVVAEFASGTKQVFDSLDECVEAGVHDRCLIRDWGVVQHESQRRERPLDAADFAGHIVDEVLEPRAHDGRCGGRSLLGFPVVAGLLTHGALGRDELRLRRRFGVQVRKALLRPAPGLGECGGAGEQPLAENLHREGSGAASGPGSRRHELANGCTEGIECGGERELARVGLEEKRRRRMPGAEPGAGITPSRVHAFRALRLEAPCVDLALQPAHHHVFDSAAHGCSHFAGAGEAHRIEHLQQAGERTRVAIVRRGGEKEPMLELRRHETQHLAKLAVFAEWRRHQVVALVDDQQIPGQMWGALRGTAGGEELLHHVRLTQVVVGGNDATERAPGIRVHAEPAGQELGFSAVDHLETE